jgi:hypothetical protein
VFVPFYRPPAIQKAGLGLSLVRRPRLHGDAVAVAKADALSCLSRLFVRLAQPTSSRGCFTKACVAPST